MADSEVTIVNTALTLLGEGRIMSLTDNTKPAREAKAIYAPTRDHLLGAYNWSFAKDRISLPSLAAAPAFGFSLQYQLPTDCLRVVMVGDYYAGLDLSDYRNSPDFPFEIEGRKILTDLGAPLNVKYIKRIVDVTLHPPIFDMCFATKIAEYLCEPITQSDSKRDKAIDAHTKALREAIRANAIELPPQSMADDSWIMSRL